MSGTLRSCCLVRTVVAPPSPSPGLGCLLVPSSWMELVFGSRAHPSPVLTASQHSSELWPLQPPASSARFCFWVLFFKDVLAKCITFLIEIDILG